MRKKAGSKKRTAKSKGANSARKTRKHYQGQSSGLDRRISESPSGRQSGDLQGLRHIERADSESIDELVEEGNAFEADVVAGVEQADNEQEREVHTHEVPEDDVPEEYLDKD